MTNKIGSLINPRDLAEEEKQVVNGFAATIARIRVGLLGMD